MRKPVLLISGLLVACSGQPSGDNLTSSTNAIAEAEPSPILKTPAGQYRIEREGSLDAKTLPSNADFKMVDGDIAKYAVKLCGLDFAGKSAPSRCEVFVQPDRTGLLIGYAALQQGADLNIETVTETDEQNSRQGCGISGKLENSDFEKPEAKLNIGSDFEARLPFWAWEKEPNNWLVSTGEDESRGDEWNGGMWYIKQQGNKLRITQERWSYCYPNSRQAYVDEVFTKAVTLVREAT